MDNKIRTHIFEDYKEAQKKIERALLGEHNFFVKSGRKYLSPTVFLSNCDYKDERGELNYFSTIRGYIRKNLIISRGPLFMAF